MNPLMLSAVKERRERIASLLFTMVMEVSWWTAGLEAARSPVLSIFIALRLFFY
jgi:hypothetical protein